MLEDRHIFDKVLLRIASIWSDTLSFAQLSLCYDWIIDLLIQLLWLNFNKVFLFYRRFFSLILWIMITLCRLVSCLGSSSQVCSVLVALLHAWAIDWIVLSSGGVSLWQMNPWRQILNKGCPILNRSFQQGHIFSSRHLIACFKRLSFKLIPNRVYRSMLLTHTPSGRWCCIRWLNQLLQLHIGITSSAQLSTLIDFGIFHIV